jgi:DNA-binding response OmpR family regulator
MIMEKRPKILILEDDNIIQHVYRALFSKTNEFDLIFCKDDTALTEELGKNHFDLFLTDLGLGQGKDGVEVIRNLRQMDEYKTSPILVITAYTTMKDEHDCLIAGATKFIRKPFDNNKIRDEIKNLTANIK